MIHLGQKLKYVQDWYEIVLLKEDAIKKLKYENAASFVDKERKLKNDDSATYQVVIVDLEMLNGKHNKNSKALMLLIRHYEEERNDRLNQILNSY